MFNKKEYQHEWYLNHRAESIIRTKLWSQSHSEHVKEYHYKWNKIRGKIVSVISHLKLKREVLAHYNPDSIVRCSKCNFSDIRALCLDHVDNDGKWHRRENNIAKKGGTLFYRQLKMAGYPEGYQTLCFNCNQIKENNRRWNMMNVDIKNINLEGIKF
jgi:hypothetical protein